MSYRKDWTARLRRSKARRTNQRGLGLELLEERRVLTTGPQMLADVNQLPAELYYPTQIASLGGVVYFVALDYAGGSTYANYELWKTDGTAAGTELVRDIWSGSGGDSDIQNLTTFGGKLVFTARDGIHGRELWTSDGTRDGTMMVADLAAGSDSSNPSSFVALNGVLYFAATDAAHGRELWKYDGTTTTRLTDLYVGGDWSDPQHLTAVGNALYFSASDGNTRKVFRYDGASFTAVVPTTGGSGWGDPRYLTNVAGVLMFIAYDGDHAGYQLWKSDGTANGTVFVKQIGDFQSNPAAFSNFTAWNDRLSFVVDDGVNGAELWTSDGTSGGTTMVADLRSGSVGSHPRNLTVLGGTLL